MSDGRMSFSDVREIDWDDLHHRIRQSSEAIDRSIAPDHEKQQQILRDRAIALAKSGSKSGAMNGGKGDAKAKAQSPDQRTEAIVFQAAGERYAFDASYVAQVLPVLPMTVIPGAPEFVVGIIAVQGEIVSVIDLRVLLDLRISSIADPTAIIVLRSETMELGVLAESVAGIELYSAASLEGELPMPAGLVTTYLKGVTPERTAILDAEQMLSDSGLIVDNGK